MKVICYKPNPNALENDTCKYETYFEGDLKFEDAFQRIKQMKEHNCRVDVYAPSVSAEFYIDEDDLCVQIDGRGFWADSPLDFEDAERILKAVYQDCDDFSGILPGTDNR